MVDVDAGVSIEMPPAPAAGSMETDEVVVLLSDLLSVLLAVLVASLADVVSVEVLEVSEAEFVVVSEVEESVVESGTDGQYIRENGKKRINVPARRSSMPSPKIIPSGCSDQAEAIIPRNKTAHNAIKLKDRMAMVV